MKRAFFITAFLLPFATSAQKLLKPSIDPITNATTWSTSVEKLYLHGNYLTAQGEAVTFQLKKFSDKNTEVLVLSPQNLNLGIELSIARDQKAYLKFSDNSTIKLTCVTDDPGNSQYSKVDHNAIRTSSASGYYYLAPGDIEKLKTGSLIFLRIETSAGNFDCDIKHKNAVLLKKAMALIDR
jgi:hypothetical protein